MTIGHYNITMKYTIINMIDVIAISCIEILWKGKQKSLKYLAHWVFEKKFNSMLNKRNYIESDLNSYRLHKSNRQNCYCETRDTS